MATSFRRCDIQINFAFYSVTYHCHSHKLTIKCIFGQWPNEQVWAAKIILFKYLWLSISIDIDSMLRFWKATYSIPWKLPPLIYRVNHISFNGIFRPVGHTQLILFETLRNLEFKSCHKPHYCNYLTNFSAITYILILFMAPNLPVNYAIQIR